jgi:hypothetical protein
MDQLLYRKYRKQILICQKKKQDLYGAEYKSANGLRPKISGFLRQGRSAVADRFYIEKRGG